MTPQAREYSTEERQELAEKGHALPDGSFPIVDREDLENAIQAVGRASDPDRAKAHIKKRARELGLTELIPEGWNDGMDPSSLRARLRRPLARAASGRDDWYRIQAKAGEAPALYIYDEIGYWGDSAKALAAELTKMDADTLDVHLNSPGGDIFDGLAIYQALKNHRASVTVHIDGLAASIASVIAMAGDRIVMAPKASLMIHDGWTMACGNAADLRETANLLDKQSDIIASVYADKSGQPAEFWRERMASDSWYDAQEALEAGLVDEILGQERATEEPFDLSVYAHAGREHAPAPVLRPSAVVKDERTPDVVEPAQPEPPAAVPANEPEPFTWDFAAFRNALREGVK